MYVGNEFYRQRETQKQMPRGSNRVGEILVYYICKAVSDEGKHRT